MMAVLLHNVLLMLSLISHCPYTDSAVQTCTTYIASPIQQYQTIYGKTYYACGYMGWSSCSKTSTYNTMYTIYVAVKDCCKGYAGPNCTAYCSFECLLQNSECSAPETCTCIDGWEGDDCVTDVNECITNIDLCEFHDTCINSEGSYSCSCPSMNQVLANDGHRCLEGVSNVVLKPGKRTIKFEVAIPDSFHDDGKFEGFGVGCSSEYDDHKSDIIILDENSTSVDLTGLSPFTSYSCCIQPRWTSNGQGPETCDLYTTTLQDAPDDPPGNFTVETISSRSILIKWSPPKVINGIIDYYILYFDYNNGTYWHLIKVSPVYTFFLHEYIIPHQTVNVTVAAVTLGGESPATESLSTTTYQDEPGAVDDLQVTVLAPYAANVSWYPPKQLNGIILQYYMNITRETPNDLMDLFLNKELEPMETFHVVLNHLEPYVPYTVSIAAATIIGLGEIYPVTFFTSQNVPSTPVVISDVHLDSPFSVTVSWVPLMLWQLRGYLQHYQLTIMTSSSSTDSNNNYCNSTSNYTTLKTTLTTISLSISPFENYCIAVSASTSAGQGEQSKWWYLQEQVTSLLGVHIVGVKYCKTWIHNNHDSKLEASLRYFSDAINSYCQCGVDLPYFTKAEFICTEADVNRVIVQASIVGHYNANSDTLIEYLQRWADTNPEVILLGEKLTVDKNCPVAINSTVIHADCIISSPVEPSSTVIERGARGLDTAEIISIVLGIGMIICLWVIVMLLTVICFNRVHSRKYDSRIDNVLYNPEEDEGDDDIDENDRMVHLELGSQHGGHGDDGGVINEMYAEPTLAGVTFTRNNNDDEIVLLDDTLY